MDAHTLARARMAHWHRLTQAEQAECIRRMAAEGWSDYGIAHATGLAVEQIRRVLGERGGLGSSPGAPPRG